MESVHVGGLGGTFGGNPVACAAALAVLDAIETDGLLDRAKEIGLVTIDRLVQMQQRFPVIGDVRGRGAMAAIELVEDPGRKTPAKQAATALIEACYREGVILLKAGTYDNVIRLLPPLTIRKGLLQEALDILEKALAGLAA
jgi:4-aminobutyrate aminotransferase/(S)-3-amino-2-methylpropionate transaminase